MRNIKHFMSMALICYATITTAQFRNEMGIEGGPGLAFVYGSSYTNSYLKPFWGGSLGGYYQFDCRRIFSIKTGLYYIDIGSQTPTQAYDQQGNPLSATKVRMNTDYLSVPVLGKLSFGGPVKFFIEAGPFASVLLNATQNYTEVYQSYTTDRTSSYKRYDAGVAFGLGLSINIKHIVINIEDRANAGFINTNSVINPENGDVRTFISSFIVGIGYKFGKR